MKYIPIIAFGVSTFVQLMCPVRIGAEEPPDAAAKARSAAAKAKSAAAGVSGVCQALNTYLREYGAVPVGNAAQIMDALTSGNNVNRIIFLAARRESFNAKGEFIDPWGTPLRIGKSESGVPWVYSFGENGIDEGGVESSDDIASWR